MENAQEAVLLEDLKNPCLGWNYNTNTPIYFDDLIKEYATLNAEEKSWIRDEAKQIGRIIL